jgi:hypothetical protein
MTRNLIATQTWKSGRDKICKMCKWFFSRILNNHRYEWEKCSRPLSKAEESSKQEGDKCRYFEPKEKKE